MFMTKKKKLYLVHSQITDFVGNAFPELHSRLFTPYDGPGLVCSAATVLVYLQIHFGGASLASDLFLTNYQDQPDLQQQLFDAINRTLNYYEMPAAMRFYGDIGFADKTARLVADPANILLDRQYGALIYASRSCADDYAADYSASIDLNDTPTIYHRFFVSYERSAQALVQSVNQLIK